MERADKIETLLKIRRTLIVMSRGGDAHDGYYLRWIKVYVNLYLSHLRRRCGTK